jgi:hypothetical protein
MNQGKEKINRYQCVVKRRDILLKSGVMPNVVPTSFWKRQSGWANTLFYRPICEFTGSTDLLPKDRRIYYPRIDGFITQESELIESIKSVVIDMPLKKKTKKHDEDSLRHQTLKALNVAFKLVKAFYVQKLGRKLKSDGGKKEEVNVAEVETQMKFLKTLDANKVAKLALYLNDDHDDEEGEEDKDVAEEKTEKMEKEEKKKVENPFDSCPALGGTMMKHKRIIEVIDEFNEGMKNLKEEVRTREIMGDKFVDLKARKKSAKAVKGKQRSNKISDHGSNNKSSSGSSRSKTNIIRYMGSNDRSQAMFLDSLAEDQEEVVEAPRPNRRSSNNIQQRNGEHRGRGVGGMGAGGKLRSRDKKRKEPYVYKDGDGRPVDLDIYKPLNERRGADGKDDQLPHRHNDQLQQQSGTRNRRESNARASAEAESRRESRSMSPSTHSGHRQQNNQANEELVKAQKRAASGVIQKIDLSGSSNKKIKFD